MTYNRDFKVGDSVYLKEEEQFTAKRTWKITHIGDDGIIYLERIVRGFLFLETAKADEIVLR